MFYCSHCGIQLEDGANFCNNCGTVTEFGRTQGSAVSQSSDLKEKPVPHMSIEDSLILVEKLQKEYTELEKLNQEIEDNKAILAKPLDTRHRTITKQLKFLINCKRTRDNAGRYVRSISVPEIKVFFNKSI